jgi:hypothetical protein
VTAQSSYISSLQLSIPRQYRRIIHDQHCLSAVNILGVSVQLRERTGVMVMPYDQTPVISMLFTLVAFSCLANPAPS